MNRFKKLKSPRFKRLTKEALWIITGQVFAISGAMIGVRVLTELLSPDDYGQLALGMTLAVFASQGGFGPLTAGATRFFFIANDSDDLKAYLSTIKRFTQLITVSILGITAAILLIVLNIGLDSWINLILASMFFACLSGYNNIVNGIQNAARQRSVVALHSGFGAWLRLGIAVFLVYLMGASSSSVMWGYVTATVIILFSQYIFFKKIFKNFVIKSPEKRNERNNAWQEKILNYSWPFVTWGSIAALHMASDKWSLALLSSQADAGFFLVLYQIGFYPIGIFSEILVTFILPIIFQRSGTGKTPADLTQATSLNIRITGIIFIISILLFIVMLIGHEMIFKILAADEYQAISYLLPWMTLSAGLISTAHVLAINRMSSLQTKSLIAPKVVPPILGIFMNLLGAFTYGLPGVVFSYLFYALIYLSWILIQYFRFTKAQSNTTSVL